jgi:hypothetical protein
MNHTLQIQSGTVCSVTNVSYCGVWWPAETVTSQTVRDKVEGEWLALRLLEVPGSCYPDKICRSLIKPLHKYVEVVP